MKLLLVFVAALGLATAAPTRDLRDDILDILRVIPVDEVRAVAQSYLNSDEEVQQVVVYLQSAEWVALVDEVASNPTVQEFKQYWLEQGIDIDVLRQIIRDWLQGLSPQVSSSTAVTRGVRELLDDVLALIPVEDLLAQFNDKLQNSEDFSNFWQIISSDRAYELVQEVRALEEVQRIANRLREMGVDVDRIIEIVDGLLGWN